MWADLKLMQLWCVSLSLGQSIRKFSLFTLFKVILWSDMSLFSAPLSADQQGSRSLLKLSRMYQNTGTLTDSK